MRQTAEATPSCWRSAVPPASSCTASNGPWGCRAYARVLGTLRGIAPTHLLDIGTGRGVFLWPLLDAFPSLMVTAVERDDVRRSAS